MRAEHGGAHILVAEGLLDGAPKSRQVVEIPEASDLGLRTPDNELQGRPLDRSDALATCAIGCARAMIVLHDRNDGGTQMCICYKILHFDRRTAILT